MGLTKAIKEGIANEIAKHYNYTIYTNSQIEGVEPPCFFIFATTDDTDKYNDREIIEKGFDIIFIQDKNIDEPEELLHEVIDTLCSNIDCIEIEIDNKTYILNCLHFENSIQDFEAHIKVQVAVYGLSIDNSIKVIDVEEKTKVKENN